MNTRTKYINSNITHYLPSAWQSCQSYGAPRHGHALFAADSGPSGLKGGRGGGTSRDFCQRWVKGRWRWQGQARDNTGGGPWWRLRQAVEQLTCQRQWPWRAAVSAAVEWWFLVERKTVPWGMLSTAWYRAGDSPERSAPAVLSPRPERPHKSRTSRRGRPRE